MIKTVLFDLDGTIVDSQLGVTRGVSYALKHFSIIEEDLEKLRIFIGPPLKEQFQAIYNMTEEDAETAVKKYREHYHDGGGINDCTLYPDVEETLKELKEKGYQISLASSKPAPACVLLLEKFGIAHYFDIIGGATFDGKISTKIQVLHDVMHRLGIDKKDEVVLIGDTKYDAEGAKEAGIGCIGITYGFGTREELNEAGTVFICDTLREAVEYIETH